MAPADAVLRTPLRADVAAAHLARVQPDAHPQRRAAARRLTAESTSEQASAGLDALTDAERARFTELNAEYTDRCGFPFIIAVRDTSKARILAAFERRLTNSRTTEFAEACRQVERIAQLRLLDLLPG